MRQHQRKNVVIAAIVTLALIASGILVYFLVLQPKLAQIAASEAKLESIRQTAAQTPIAVAATATPVSTPVGPYMQRVARQYDNAGNLIKIEVSDIEGNLIRIDSEDLHAEYTYDPEGRVLSETKFNSAETPYSKTEYEYDAEGRELKSIEYSIVNEKKSVYESNTSQYDSFGNIISHVTNSKDGSLKEAEECTYTYGDAGQVLKIVCVITDATEGPITETTTNRYDTNGNLVDSTYVCESRNEFVSSCSSRTRYEYDALNRCTKETNLSGSSVDDYYEYEYDANNVRRKSTLYSAEDDIVRVTVYDETGEKTVDGVPENEYDGFGVLQIDFHYDAYNKRILKTVYTYDENGLVAREDYTAIDSKDQSISKAAGYCEYEYIY